MVYSYIRQVPSFPNLVKQQGDILSFSLNKKLKIDQEVVEYATKNLTIDTRKEFEYFLQSMQEDDTVLVSSLSILSDRAEELIKVLNCMLKHSVNLWIVNSNMLINKGSSMVEIFPLLNQLRKDKKVKTKQIGRPKGSKSTSKFDVYHGKIIALLRKGKNVSAIARELKVSRSSLKDYIGSRKIKELVQSTRNQINENSTMMQMDNIVLICPFEEIKDEKNKKVS